jgi:hypothetical protein
VLAIEPKEETACENIVVAAVDWTDDLIEEKEFDKAKEVLEDVQTVVEDARLEKKITEVEMAQEDYEVQLEAEAQIMDTLNELAEICAAEDADAVFTYMNSDTYTEICASEYFNFDTKYETENGSLGLYKEGAYLYYGDYDGEQRSGQGAWYHSGYNYEVGTWTEDKPNGAQKAVFRAWNEDEEPGSETMEGNVVDGLWDGSVVLTDISGNTWNLTYHSGQVVVLGTNKFGNIVSEANGGGLAFGSDSGQNAGILGFADSHM